MELKSDPQYADVQVTDIDAAYPGDVQSYTLRNDVDTHHIDISNNTLVIAFGTGGTITFYRERAHWIAIRPRTLRVPVPQTGE